MAISAASAGVGTIGVLLLGYLLATHALTPRHLQYTLSLPLDLDGNTLSAQASVLQANSPAAGYILHLPDKERTVASRMFPPGQWMDIWVDLMVPGWADADTRNADLVHVTAELLNASGQVAARATKPVLLQNRSFSVWWVAPVLTASKLLNRGGHLV